MPLVPDVIYLYFLSDHTKVYIDIYGLKFMESSE